MILPRHVIGGKGYTSPSDKLNIAGVGVRKWGMGSGNLSSCETDNIVALCDVDHKLSAETFNKYPKAKVYKDFRVMLETQKDIDAVIVATPDHTHAIISMMSIKLGKHIFCQKPLTHTVYEARVITETARKYKVQTQMGNQGRSSEEIRRLKEWIDDGAIGPVRKVYAWTDRPVGGNAWDTFDAKAKPKEKPPIPKDLDWDLWLGPAASAKYTSQLHPFNWRGWWDYGTGALGDMGCHILDAPYKTLGLHYPTDVECSVGQVFQQAWSHNFIPAGCPASSIVTLNFDKTTKNDSKIELVWMDGGLRPSHPEFIPADDFLGEKNSTNGVLMIGETGVISCGVYGLGPKLYRKGHETIEFSTDDYWKSLDHVHHMEWINGIKAGYGSDEYKKITAPFEYAGPFTETVLMGNLAIRSYMSMGKDKPKYSPNRYHTSEYSKFVGRKKLLWDGDNMKITNFDEANKFVGRTRRSGWNI